MTLAFSGKFLNRGGTLALSAYVVLMVGLGGGLVAAGGPESTIVDCEEPALVRIAKYERLDKQVIRLATNLVVEDCSPVVD